MAERFSTETLIRLPGRIRDLPAQAAARGGWEVRTNPRVTMSTIVLLFWAFSLAGYGLAHSGSAQVLPDEPSPGDTVVLANRIDARYSQDFSVLLKSLSLEWVVVDSASVPDSVKDKNLILLGRPDAEHTGEIMRSMLTAEDLDAIRSAGDGHVVLIKSSPWAEGRTVYICTGDDLLLTRNAAEGAVRGIVASSPPASAWIRTRFDAPLEENVRETVERLRYAWDDAELPLADLIVEPGAKPLRRVSAQQAAEDVGRLFYLLSHGYSGYGYFDQQGEFDRAEARILETLATRSGWSTDELARLIREQLSFVTDCHLNIGDIRYAGHHDFWYDTTLEVVPGDSGYDATIDGARHTLAMVNGQDPESYLYPSLNAQGEPVYRLGALSKPEPAPLALAAVDSNNQQRQIEIPLQRSDFVYYSDDRFREDTVGGIPIIRIRSFADEPTDPVTRFVETAGAHSDAPVVVVDIRGNGGGNEAWPNRWVQALTGASPRSVFVFGELNSKTTMAGRANLFAQLQDQVPDSTFFRQELARFTSSAQAFEEGSRQPGWTGPVYPRLPLIANDTTVVIVMNGLVASAGEGMVMRASQAENVVLVGENSMGCLHFGNVSSHQLPHSRLPVRMPINAGLFPDMAFREGVGIAPDLWVPAADAVNYAVAAVRAGTITTQQPLSAGTLQQRFIPEGTWAGFKKDTIISWLVIVAPTVAGAVWAYFLRKRPRIVAGTGIVWLIISVAWISMERPLGFGFLSVGGLCLLWGGINFLRARKAATETSA